MAITLGQINQPSRHLLVQDQPIKVWEFLKHKALEQFYCETIQYDFLTFILKIC